VAPLASLNLRTVSLKTLSVSRRVTVPLDTEAPLIHPSAYIGLATWVILLKICRNSNS